MQGRLHPRKRDDDPHDGGGDTRRRRPLRRRSWQLFDEFESRVPVKPASLGIDVEVQYSQKPIRPGDKFRAALGLTYCKHETDDCKAYEIRFDDRVVRDDS